MMKYANSIKLCYWNIGGIHNHITNKFGDDSFINDIKDDDVVILAETHVGCQASISLKIVLIFLYVEIYRTMEDIMGV